MSIFDPTEYPFTRAATYVDNNPPAVLANVFYNPTQDALAGIYGAAVGYSTTSTNEEFILQAGDTVPSSGDPFGVELAVVNNTMGDWTYASVSSPASAGVHGAYRIKGTVAGNRGGAPGFEVADAPRNVGTMRWIFRARLRCSKFSVLSAAGLVVGVGPIVAVPPPQNPLWFANGGVWNTLWDGGGTATAIPTVNDEWVTLWIANKYADGVVRWYLQRDTDPEPMLLDTETLVNPDLTSLKRYMQVIVTGAAVAADNVEIDSIGLLCER